MLSPFHFPLNQSRAFQYHKVLGDGVQGNRKILRNIGNPGGLSAEPPEDGSPRRVSHGREDAIESGRAMLNHLVEYKGGFPSLSSPVLHVFYTESMSTQVTRKRDPAPRTLRRRNTMAFPRELRAAIPDLHAGRVLELDSIDGRAANTQLFGPMVELKLLVKETGKLTGEFVVRMGLQADAARRLAATLTQLADQAEESNPGSGLVW